MYLSHSLFDKDLELILHSSKILFLTFVDQNRHSPFSKPTITKLFSENSKDLI